MVSPPRHTTTSIMVFLPQPHTPPPMLPPSPPTTSPSMAGSYPHHASPPSSSLLLVTPRPNVAPSTPPNLPTPATPDDEDDEDEDFEITGVCLALEDVMAECELDEDEDTLPLQWELPVDDECINGCAALLQCNFHDPKVSCAILSTFVIPEVLKNSMRTETAWRSAYRTQYWAKPIWVIPIHDKDQHHWGLAVVRVEKEEIHIFDSFGSHDFVERWLPKIQLVVSRLVDLAKDHGYPPTFASLSTLSSWTARPLQTNRIQHNGYDCGVWVLWMIAAIIRGFDYAFIEEKHIAHFRKYLSNIVRTIPVK
ncbi:hypothetical protein PQX77_003630 [Marasmius sp. AFHP31]|nr:hypothetical protein PQX77_003630 [Marasmius sp. AFHP31]